MSKDKVETNKLSAISLYKLRAVTVYKQLPGLLYGKSLDGSKKRFRLDLGTVHSSYEISLAKPYAFGMGTIMISRRCRRLVMKTSF